MGGRLFAPRLVRARHTAEHRCPVAARRLFWGRGRSDRTIWLSTRRPARETRRSGLLGASSRSAACLMASIPGRTRSPVATRADDDNGSVALHRFVFAAEDTILLGRESAGVPEAVHSIAGARVAIPLRRPAR